MAEKVITLVLLLGGLVYLFSARSLAFGILASPKSGFLPALAGTVAVILALTLVVSQWRFPTSLQRTPVNWTTFFFILIGFLFYVTILRIIGFFSATFIFLFYLMKAADTPGWTVPFMVAACSATCFYLLFERYLAVILP
jgi:putative tricarboxylic transport membrane protein